MPDKDGPTLRVRGPSDIHKATRLVRDYASTAGLPISLVEQLVLATSELAANVVRHSSGGGTVACAIRSAPAEGGLLEVEVRDDGPGIAQVDLAMQDGYSTAGSLGSGLPAARRLVDFFNIDSGPGGTTVRLGMRLPYK